MSSAAESLPAFRTVSVIMERVKLANRWAVEQWEALAVLCNEPAVDATERVIVEHADRIQMLFPGQRIVLRPDECEGYYMNITSPQPRVFVLWRMQDDIGRPELLSVSYHEGARWMDSDEHVDGVALPAELLPWIGAYVERHYRPEPRKPKRYATSKDRGRMGHF